MNVLGFILFFVWLSLSIVTQGLADEQGDARLVEIKERGFSLLVPKMWNVRTNHYGASLFIEPLENESPLYKRNIQVMAFSGSLFIDELELLSFSEKIRINAGQMSNAIVDYAITDQLIIEMPDGSHAMLFYARFNYAKQPMMQMHLALSSASDHFIIVYTDLEEFFESNGGAFVDEAFAIMQSAKLDSVAPKRSFYFYMVFGSMGGLFVIFWLYRKIRMTFFRRMLAEHSEGLDGDDDQEEHSLERPSVHEQVKESSFEVDDAFTESAYSNISQSGKGVRAWLRKRAAKKDLSWADEKPDLPDELGVEADWEDQSDDDPMNMTK